MRDIRIGIIWWMVFNANIRYKDMIENFLLSGFFCSVVHFPRVVAPFLLNGRHCIFFSTVYVSFICLSVHVAVSTSTVPFQTIPPRLLIHASKRKGSRSLYSKDFRSTTSHYSSPSVSFGCYYVKRHKYTWQYTHYIYIYIYIYLRREWDLYIHFLIFLSIYLLRYFNYLSIYLSQFIFDECIYLLL